MAFKHGSKARVYVNGYDLSAYLKRMRATGDSDVHDTTCFNAVAKEYAPGLKDATLSAEGLFDGDTGGIDEILHAALGNQTSIWTWYPQGDNAVGDNGYGFDAIETAYEVETPVEDLAVISADAQSKVGRERIRSLHPLSEESATGNGAALDNGGPTSNGAVAYLQVTDLLGTAPTLDVTIQHSPDNLTWSDLITFTQVSSAHVSERKTFSGIVERYVRVVWTPSSGATAKFNVALGRK